MYRSVLYLTPGIFDKGGISRYCRYQVRALRQLLGAEHVRVHSLLSPDGRGFEESFQTEFSSFGPTPLGKTTFAAVSAVSALADRPSLLWSAHVHFASLAYGLSRITRSRMVQNVYGREVWTDLAARNANALRKCDAVVSDCHATLDYIRSAELRPSKLSVVHWDCVDMTRFTPGDPGDVLSRYGVPPADGYVTLMTLGRLEGADSHKGFARLIQAMDLLPPQTPLRLVVAGGGPDRDAFESLARRMRARDRIFFTGSIEEHDLARVYRACDIFALVSDRGHGRGEGIPLTPLEAAACGKPIVVGNHDGSREAATHGVSGFVLDPFDSAALVDVLAKLTTDPALRQRIGHAAHERIAREHSYTKFVERTRELLRTMGMHV